MSSLQALHDALAQAAQIEKAEIRLLRLADLRQAVDAAIVTALAEVEAAPGAIRLDGAVDGAQWLAARSELHPAEASALAALARDLPDMPATGEALEAGRIGTEKARLLRRACRIDAFPEAEAGLVERVVGASLRMARRVVNRFIAEHQNPAPADPAANEVTLAAMANGRWRLSGDLDHETATLITNELRRLTNAYRDDEGLSPARRTALALLEMARRSVTLGERGPGSRPELVVVADVGIDGELSDLRHEDGTPVSRRVFEQLCCDCTVRGLVMDGPSDPLDLGRAQRIGTQGQRRAASVRDGGCVYPGCERPPEECDLHHLRHWLKHHGSTDLANLCLLCRRHHTLTHVMGFTFVRRPGGQLIIYGPEGVPIPMPGQQAA